MLEQVLINQVVEETYNGALTADTEKKFISNTDNFQIVEFFKWHSIDEAFSRNDLLAWESYFSVDEMVSFGFSENQIDKWTETKRITDQEYLAFLRSWIEKIFADADYSYIHDVAFHQIAHSDGRSCIALLAMKEGGQCGWQFEDVYVRMFKSSSEATAHLNASGLFDTSSDEELERYVQKAASHQ